MKQWKISQTAKLNAKLAFSEVYSMPRSCYWTLWDPCKYFWARVSKKPLTVCFNSILQQKIIAATFPEISNKEGTKKI